MTTVEHTLVGIHVAFALGCHRHIGPPAVVMAGLASNVPDCDGLPMLVDMQRFEAGHRVWGHNLLAITLSSVLLGWTQHRYDWISSVSRWTVTKFLSQTMTWSPGNKSPEPASLMVYVGIAAFAQLLHLPCDMVVSGGIGLSDWAIKPFWPFRSTSFVYPMIPWGDVGPTVILMSGVILLAKLRRHVSLTSIATLVVLCGYLLVRGWSRGTLVF